jgi:hypothetical protein
MGSIINLKILIGENENEKNVNCSIRSLPWVFSNG